MERVLRILQRPSLPWVACWSQLINIARKNCEPGLTCATIPAARRAMYMQVLSSDIGFASVSAQACWR